MWNALVELPDVRIGVFGKLAEPDPSATEGGAAQSTERTSQAKNATAETAEQPGDREGDSPEPSGSGKRKKKKIERKAEGPTHEMRILPAAERDLGREALTDKFGDRLRVLSGEETTWVAITGSHLRVRRFRSDPIEHWRRLILSSCTLHDSLRPSRRPSTRCCR